MKLKIAILCAVTLLNVGCTKEVSSNQATTQAEASITPEAKSVAQVPLSGKFVAAEHPTTGMVSVVAENGKNYIELDEAFKTNNGPDLFVIFHRSEKPPISGIKEKDYVSIGRLQKVSGTQRYAIPANVNPADFRSVAIWCRQFNATFGFALLSS
ncbi:DM13 domain-containing protein [Trichocoleus sp. FACHB-90]|uniref:DM13 domain-containing protein n=1 Tax=Cyanophyceae TaxID=3028117 RepID=UPI0016886DBA|nr:DM13 domain-containing protein [Trichocoleus sp. FACHB-90]MBD1925920.1 DM13 domain-containing protein [Trichocoleus sp. FACHB-90]